MADFLNTFSLCPLGCDHYFISRIWINFLSQRQMIQGKTQKFSDENFALRVLICCLKQQAIRPESPTNIWKHGNHLCILDHTTSLCYHHATILANNENYFDATQKLHCADKTEAAHAKTSTIHIIIIINEYILNNRVWYVSDTSLTRVRHESDTNLTRIRYEFDSCLIQVWYESYIVSINLIHNTASSKDSTTKTMNNLQFSDRYYEIRKMHKNGYFNPSLTGSIINKLHSHYRWPVRWKLFPSDSL